MCDELNFTPLNCVLNAESFVEVYFLLDTSEEVAGERWNTTFLFLVYADHGQDTRGRLF